MTAASAGFLCLVVVYATAVYVGFVQQSVDLGWMYDHYVPLLTGSCLLSVTLTVYLYVSSFKPGTMLAAGTPRCRPRRSARALLNY